MEKKLSNNVTSLPYKPIIEAARESIDYIDQRRKGLITSLETPWAKFNKISMNGLEWHTIHTFAGMSGSGKSALLNQLETELISLNPNQQFSILSFNFEMLARNLVSRKFSKALNMTVQQLHSGVEEVIVTDRIYNRLVEEGKKLSTYPIYYVDIPGTVMEIYQTAIKFSQEPFNQGKGIVITLDHSILVKGNKGELERTVCVELMTMFNYLKKKIKCVIVILSQLNRDIESAERLMEPSQHFPKKKDIFASDSLYQFSDTVSVIMNPEQLGITAYGSRALPVKGFIYIHCLKVREGEPAILQMLNQLKYNRIIDYYSPTNLYNLNEA